MKVSLELHIMKNHAGLNAHFLTIWNEDVLFKLWTYYSLIFLQFLLILLFCDHVAPLPFLVCCYHTD